MIETVMLHAASPPKPAAGKPCNGCGACCAVEPCPVALLLLPNRRNPCPALEWDAEQARYRCGMVAHPAHYLRWLPRRWQAWAGRRFAYRIAAGCGCDFEATEV